MGALPSSSRQLLVAICAWCGALGLPATALAAIELVSQARSVEAAWSATIEFDPPDHPAASGWDNPHTGSEDETAADFGPFSAGVSTPGASENLEFFFGPLAPWGGFSGASQESGVSQNGVVTIQAEGEAWGGPYYFQGCNSLFFDPELCIESWDIGANARSLFSITFEVDERTLYRLSGGAAANYFQGGGQAEVILREAGGAILFETDGFDCWFHKYCDPQIFSVTHVLTPGTYTVSALAYGSGSLWLDGTGMPVGGEGWGSYALTLELIPPTAQLPALGVASRLLLAMLLPLLAVKVVRCRSAGRRPRP